MIPTIRQLKKVLPEIKLEKITWIPLYISGKWGFKDAVQARIQDFWLQGTPELQDTLIMFWLHKNSDLRKFKLAIGSSIIFRYRLRFFMNLNEYIRSEAAKSDTGNSMEESEMIQKMIRWENRNSHFSTRADLSQEIK